MPRVSADFKNCLTFIAEKPHGQATKRRREILAALAMVRRHPKARRVTLRKSRAVDFRTHYVAQFMIIYAYFEPNAVMQNGIVSIRAIRHRRVRNPFQGVKEPEVDYSLGEPRAR